MVNKKDVLEAIFQAISGVNETLPTYKKIEKLPETALFGVSSTIDSLELTLLIVAIEQKIVEVLGQRITLVDHNTMSEEKSPFLTIQTLVDYITVLLEDCASV